jgi:hypothetical protein
MNTFRKAAAAVGEISGCLLELVREAAAPRDSRNYGSELNKDLVSVVRFLSGEPRLCAQLFVGYSSVWGMDDEVNELAGNDLEGGPRGISQ